MILLCEHPAAVAGAKVENGFIVFQGPQGRLLHRSAGGESAHSRFRSDRGRPGAPAGGSRCERSLDTRSWCAASSRVVPPTCAPLPLSPPPWACGGNGVDTACEILRPGALPSAPLPPASAAESDCLVWKSPLAAAVRRNCARAESAQVAGHLLAAREATDVADGQHKRQRGYWAHSRLRHQQAGLRVLFRCLQQGLI